nr:MAG TPA: hypothetical protein [Caudoviricetes sp.]DAS01747.1 MAG TPA: hypothetical protein [Caudoviricetes sp.]
MLPRFNLRNLLCKKILICYKISSLHKSLHWLNPLRRKRKLKVLAQLAIVIVKR